MEVKSVPNMNRLILGVVAAAVVAGLIMAVSVQDQTAVAGSNKKYHFTETVVSSLSPGLGHESHQLAMILSPNQGTIYDGSVTFTSSQPVQIVVLHEIDSEDAAGQPTWTIDSDTIYGWTLIEAGKVGSFEYTGAALAFHNSAGDEFVVTASVDGWIRGQPTDIILQNPAQAAPEPSISLGLASVPATIPMHAGMHDGGDLTYIVTDASDADWSAQVSESQGWRVEVAPPLAEAPEDALNTMYVFTNGESGDGLYGYQGDVFAYTPGMEQYSALSRVIEITWKAGQNQTPFEYASDVTDAINAGRVNVKDTGIVANTPHIMWPDGQMQVREDADITNDMAYGGGQVTEIDTEEMTVTFVAHRGWGPDGQTIYYIVTDATPTGPANNMGVVDAPSIAALITNQAAVDLFQFNNGLVGTGPLGFQPGIAAAAPGDDTYSPMWRIYLVEWNDADDAVLLETLHDITHYGNDDMLTTTLARPANSDHIVNCPFIDPFQ